MDSRLVQAVKFENRIGNFINLIDGQFRIDRQAQNAAGQSFADWELTGSMPQTTPYLHEVNRDRIMDSRPDAAFFQMLTQLIPFIRLHYKSMINAKITRPVAGTTEAGTSCEALAIMLGARAA